MNDNPKKKAVAAIRRIIAAAKDLTKAERALACPPKKVRRGRATLPAEGSDRGN